MSDTYKILNTNSEDHRPGIHLIFLSCYIVRNTTDPNDFMPNCTTAEMIEALDGHLSLIHSTFANDDDIIETGESVQQWKDSLRAQVNESVPLPLEAHWKSLEPSGYLSYMCIDYLSYEQNY